MKKQILVALLALVMAFAVVVCIACEPEQPATYVLTYAAGEGSGAAPEAEKYAEGAEAVIKANPFTAPAGKEFDCWSDGSKTYKAGDKLTMPKADVTLTAQWKNSEQPAPEQWTVTFMNGTEKVSEAKVEKGQKLTASQIPQAPSVAADKEFKGWFNGETEITVDSVINGNITAVAKIENKPVPQPEYWTVTFKSGTITVKTVKVEKGQKLTAEQLPPDPVGLPDSKEFKGWFDGETKIDENSVISADVTAVAKVVDKSEPLPETWTITLNAGEGTLPEGAKTAFSADKASGKIILAEGEYLPVPTIAAAHYRFDNWYDAQTGGNAIDEEVAVFEKDTVLYARYVREDGIWVGAEGSEVFKAALVKNSGAALTGGLKAEYWLGGSKLTLAKGDRITVVMNGSQISFFVLGSSSGIEHVSETTKQKSVTVSVAGEFAFYVKDYTTASDPTNWVCQFAGPNEVVVGSEIPAGCAPIHVSWGDGAYELTLFIVINTGNEPVGVDKLDEFSLYNWEPALFGDWNTAARNGKCALEMTSSVAGGFPGGWIIRRSQQQTQDITSFKNHGVYLINFTPKTHGTSVITELTIASTQTITLDLGYAEQPETKATTKAYNGKLTYTPIATREGYDFAGWYDAAEGGSEVTLDKVYSGNATIYARWTPAKAVTLDENYEGKPENTIEYAYGGKLASLPKPARDDYDFLGWYDAAAEGTEITLDTVFTENKTIYAQWKLKVAITLDLNYEGKDDDTIVKANLGKLTSTNLKIPANRVVGEGDEAVTWYCDGWFTAKEGGEKVTTSTVFTANQTIYARWRVAYKVTFDYNYGEGETSPDSITLSADAGKGNSFLPATFPAPVRANYDFEGWYDAAEGGTRNYAGTTLTADVTYYARWSVGKIVTFDLNYEGQPEEKQTLTTTNKKLAALPENPVREGYEFVGWYTKATGGFTVAVTREYASDTTVYARWKQTTFEVTFDLNYEVEGAEPTKLSAVDGKLTDCRKIPPARATRSTVGSRLQRTASKLLSKRFTPPILPFTLTGLRKR